MSAKVYLAGPDVFRRDARARGDELRALCAAHGVEGLYPLDADPAGDAPDAAAIRRRCIALIQEADAVVANISPFRGHHMDPGTAWEMGYAQALRMPVYCWSADPRPIAHRIAAADADEAGARDADGHLIEDFGLAENLMIAPADGRVWHGAEEAIAAAAAGVKTVTAARSALSYARRRIAIGLVLALAATFAAGFLFDFLAGP